jgi:hypothetical protein
MNQVDLQKILGLLQGCHSILGLCWPRPGIAQMAGSKIFIGTKPFIALEEGVRLTTSEFELLRTMEKIKPAFNVWHLIVDVVAEFRRLGPKSQSPDIDPAYNLIYLATGVLYHQIATSFTVVPKPVPPYATVERMDKLLADCGWNGAGLNLGSDEILDSISVALKKSLTTLKSH